MKCYVDVMSNKKLISSPSVWRVWIEIIFALMPAVSSLKSPSVWRVWIEMYIPPSWHIGPVSPSVWRVWIEIHCYNSGYRKRI